MAFAILSFIGVLGVAGFLMSFFDGNGYGMIFTGICAVAGSVSGIVRTNRSGPDNHLGAGCRTVATLFFLGLALLFALGILLGVSCVRTGGF